LSREITTKGRRTVGLRKLSKKRERKSTENKREGEKRIHLVKFPASTKEILWRKEGDLLDRKDRTGNPATRWALSDQPINHPDRSRTSQHLLPKGGEKNKKKKEGRRS